MSARILVVEDDRAINQLLVQTLSEDGFTLLSAGHGREALDLLETERPDAIILDLNMPVMDGRTFMRQLRNDPRDDVCDIPVLVLSAERVVKERDELGVQDSITKPFDIDGVSGTLQGLLQGQRSGRHSAVSA